MGDNACIPSCDSPTGGKSHYHKFEPRFDVFEKPIEYGPAPFQIKKKKIYVHDICVRCGKVVSVKNKN